MKTIDTKDAVGSILCHDITQIVRGVVKDAKFRKGHIVTQEDIPVLLSLGKEHLFVWEETEGMVHEDEAALTLLKICQNTNMKATPVKEGKIELLSEIDGLFTLNSDALKAVNSLDDIMIATRIGNSAVQKGDKLAGFRIIPLVIQKEQLEKAEQAAGSKPILTVTPWQIKKAAIITTGSEIQKGLIKDTFTDVIKNKLAAFNIEVIYHKLSGDDSQVIQDSIHEAKNAGAEIVICTGGMSVDPDDRTPGAIKASGAKVVTYGAPVLPGAMFLLSYLGDNEETKISGTDMAKEVVPVLGIPGCAMYAAYTVLDIFLPRLVARKRITKQDIIDCGEGGLVAGRKAYKA